MDSDLLEVSVSWPTGIAVFADTSSITEIRESREAGLVSGFTTNPTLMRAAGAFDYLTFARNAIEAAQGYPISFEVIADIPREMVAQGRSLANLSSNAVVKIPITTTRRESAIPVVRELLDLGITVNVTAVMTDAQVHNTLEVITDHDDVIISVFAGRIADTGVDPEVPLARYTEWARDYPGVRILWASPREILNVVQAKRCGCDIITVTPALLKKFELFGKDLEEFSLETVTMFYEDALAAGLKID